VGNANPLNHARYDPGTVGDANPTNHLKYTDVNAVAAMGVLDNTNPLNHTRYSDANAVAAVVATGNYYTKAEINAIVASYYTLNTDARAIAGRRIYIQAGDPGAISNGDVWHQT
jgi:hypothetical protein